MGFFIVIYNEDVNFVYFLFMIYSLDFSDFFLMLDDDYYWFIRVYGQIYDCSGYFFVFLFLCVIYLDLFI